MLGALPQGDGTVRFSVWAPRAPELRLRVRGAEHALGDEGGGLRAVTVAASPGDDYAYVVDGAELPDPCSRWQPAGLRGPSRVLDTASFTWTDAGWRPPPLSDLVLYELHVGTFTPEGTFEAIIPHLRELRELGVTAIELMPVAEFPGARGWGYDGVYLSAAQSSYGGPHGLARLVDAAHAAGLAVILDVVYNHLGASGVEAMEAFAPYFTARHETAWGKAIDFGEEGVREWVLQSAEGWVRDFHVDGLRLDAIHAIVDESPEHIVAAIARRVHAANPRALVIAESNLNDAKVVRASGYGCDATWADDFHHALHVLLTGEREGYYRHFGAVAQLAAAFHRPYVRPPSPADDVEAPRFVVFSQNHDQVGNRAFGDRLPEPARRLAALCTLLSPFTPMLFMGEEYGEPAPFQFFSDHIDAKIARATRDGRRREFAAFSQFGREVPDPQDEATFTRSKLTRVEVPGMRELYRELLALRRDLPAEASVVTFDEGERWLRVRRGPVELVCNFSDRQLRLPGAATMPPLSGAVVG